MMLCDGLIGQLAMARTFFRNSVSCHTAHHRGALTVYARALGKTPAMPYGGESEGA